MDLNDKKQTVKYDINLLNTIIKRDNSTLIGDYKSLHVYSVIKFICKCAKEDSKKFRSLYGKGGAFCRECAKINGKKKSEATNLEKFGVKNPFASKDIQNKIKKDNLEKYGVEHNMKRKEVVDKVKNKYNLKSHDEKMALRQKILDKHNAKSEEEKQQIIDKRLNTFNAKPEEEKKNTIEKRKQTYYSKTQEDKEKIRAKIKKTNLEKYGVENVFSNTIIKTKMKETNIKKYGTEYATQSIAKEEWDRRMEKRKQTNIDRFGYENPAQHPEIFERIQESAKRFKEYKMPSGAIRKIQGYEGFALDELVKIYEEDQIKTDRKDVGRIKYNLNGLNKYYNPDIGIPHENKLIEVKSKFTYTIEPEKIKCKGDACKSLGFNYEIWIYNSKGNKEVIKF